MPKRIYLDAAEKQKAYRERQRARSGGIGPPKMPKPRRQTRPDRLREMEAAARSLAEEYEHWRESMPEHLGETSLAQQLEAVIEGLQSIADELAALETPRIGR